METKNTNFTTLHCIHKTKNRHEKRETICCCCCRLSRIVLSRLVEISDFCLWCDVFCSRMLTKCDIKLNEIDEIVVGYRKVGYFANGELYR